MYQDIIISNFATGNLFRCLRSDLKDNFEFNQQREVCIQHLSSRFFE